MRGWVGLLGCLALGGCLEAGDVRCDDGRLCPAGTACVVDGCATPEQIEACEGVAAGGACSLRGVGGGACVDGWCQVPVCGNLRLDVGEVCDDGNQAVGDGCNATCSSTEACGNGFVDVGEACDCGTATPADGCVDVNGAPDVQCRVDCTLMRCGDGVVDAELDEACDAGDANSAAADAPCRPNCQLPRCGDGVTDPALAEVCDDGNQVAGDGCTPDCASDETCGNGVLDFFAGEQCDDGGRRRGDGCAPECRLERPTWSEREGTPRARSSAAIAYDVARGKVVLFGGSSSSGYLSETWEWDGAAWRPMPTLRAPTARAGAAMAYDRGAARVVLFGGMSGAGRRGDTWEWDGTAWTERTVAGPSARVLAAAASDGEAGVLLFGGQDGAGMRADTWRWDGASWTELAPATSPSARVGHALVAAPAGGVLLFGGQVVGGGRSAETWRWDGTTWVALSPAAAPSARAGHTLATDTRRGRVVLMGGDTGAPSAATWEFDGSTWLQASAGAPPAARARAAMAYDAARGTMVLHGGETPGLLGDTLTWDGAAWTSRTLAASPLQQYVPAVSPEPTRGTVLMFGGLGRTAGVTNAETWRWDGGRWTQLTPATAPSARADATLTYDPVRDEVILFGGHATFTMPSAPSSETWAWDGATWTKRTPAMSAPARWGHAAVWDSRRQRIVLFGGRDDAGRKNDTWTWDGTTWTELVDAQVGAPPARVYFGMTYDQRRDRVVVFGGESNGATFIADTWEFDGTSWTSVDAATSPPGRVCLGTLQYEPTRERVILYGGLGDAGPVNDTWEWDGVTWTSLTTVGVPDLDGYYALTPAAVDRELLLIGGDRGAGRLATWTFAYLGDSAPEACASGRDYDADLVQAGDDDDCWGVCSPACAPASAEAGGCELDDPALPRCGDGTCQPVEDCRSCAADCGACPLTCGDLVCDDGEDAAGCPVDCA